MQYNTELVKYHRVGVIDSYEADGEVPNIVRAFNVQVRHTGNLSVIY